MASLSPIPEVAPNYWDLLPDEVVEYIVELAENNKFNMVCKRFFAQQFIQKWVVKE